MNDERVIDEEAVFSAAIAIDEADKQLAYLRQACGGDDALLARMEALLRIHASKTSFIEQAANSLQWTIDVPVLVEGPGTVIDRYKLLEKIGEGGMAVVHMAEQQYPIRRRVALKIIKLGMDTKNVIARFEAERQALALMDHPNIAKVFDGGATENGRPYFVMELVRGVSITDYCDQNRLSTHDRLELFVQVCNAVQHAHQKGIIHRDIKPSNVMVTLHDGKPVPKVIDFGIAKATNQRLTEQTLFTRYSQMIGTPEYMSPEQAEMSGLDIDTRADIYSLGVLLYELLTGVTPFASETLRDASYAEMQRILRETDPLKPSTRIRTLGQTLSDVAQFRQTSPELLPKLVKGDLDWIVMKTLEKDRTHRYETAHALAEDIERHLRHEPILAGSPGAVYRVRKFLRRHRAKVITSSAATIVLAGLLFAGITYARFNLQQTRSSHEKLLVQVEDLLPRGEYQQALSEIKPILSSRYVGPKARLLHARIVLELQGPRAGIEQLQALLKEQPEVAANAHFLLARVYLQGDPNDPWIKGKAEIHLQQGERLMPKTAEAYLLRAMMVPTVPEILGCLDKALDLDPTHYGARRTRALAYYALGQYHEMETEASMMIGSQPTNPTGHMLRAMARREIGLAKNDADLLRQAILDHDRAVGLTAPRDKRRLEICDQRRQTLMRTGRYDQALADVQTCLRLQPDEILHQFDFFFILTALGRQEEAQAKYDEIVKADASEAPRFLARGGWPNWAGDSTRVYYHSRADHKMYCIGIDPKATGQQEVMESMDMFPFVSPDGRYAALMTPEATLQIVDLSDRSVVPGWSGPPDRQQLFPSWSPDGTKLSVGAYNGGGLWIYDVQKKEASKVLEGAYAWCTWSDPKGTRLAIEKVYAQWHHEIWIIDQPLSPKPAVSQRHTAEHL